MHRINGSALAGHHDQNKLSSETDGSVLTSHHENKPSCLLQKLMAVPQQAILKAFLLRTRIIYNIMTTYAKLCINSTGSAKLRLSVTVADPSQAPWQEAIVEPRASPTAHICSLSMFGNFMRLHAESLHLAAWTVSDCGVDHRCELRDEPVARGAREASWSEDRRRGVPTGCMSTVSRRGL